MNTVTPVGKFIRAQVTGTQLSNKAIVEMVMSEFPTMKFSAVKLCQRIANTRHNMRKQVETTVERTDTSALGEAATNP